MTTPNIIRVGTQGPQGPKGDTGAPGANGTNGTNGINAVTATTASFTQPAPGATASVAVGSTAWMAVGQEVFIEGGGYYTVGSLTSGTMAVMTNTGYTGNAASGATVASAAVVSPAGVQGPIAFSRTINDATASRVLAASDAGAYIRMTSSSANTVTVPADTFLQDDEISVFRAGTGSTTLVAGAGVTINAAGLAITAQNKAVTIKCVDAAANTFDVVGAV